MRIVFASGNRGKFREMKAQLEPIGVELLFGGDMEGPHEIEETGETYADNALIKARAWAEATGLPALADDSGLEADALGGLPGVHSARIVEGSDSDRTRWLLGELADKDDRRGRFAPRGVRYHGPGVEAVAVSSHRVLLLLALRHVNIDSLGDVCGGGNGRGDRLGIPFVKGVRHSCKSFISQGLIVFAGHKVHQKSTSCSEL